MTANILTADRLRTLLHYDPETGIFTRLVRTARRVHIGDVAGGKDEKGYLRIRLDGRKYRAHRLVWLYVHGSWPIDQIDHANGDKADNRLINLREASNMQNTQNIREPRKTNTSGFLGVSWHSRANRWASNIGVNGKRIHLGYFATADLAYAAYVTAKREHHPACTI